MTAGALPRRSDCFLAQAQPTICHHQCSLRCVKIRLKRNSLNRVREWAATLNEVRREEALATLRDETVIFEAAFLDRTSGGDFLI